MTPVIPLSPLRIENNRLGIECWFTRPPSQVGYADLQIEPAARELNRCRGSNFGGPKCPLALFEAPTPSRGIPRKLLSSLPFEFSSWKSDTAYLPTAMPQNSQIPCPWDISDWARRTALSLFL